MLTWHQNLIGFWRPLGTRFFRLKRRQDAKTPQIAAEDGVGPGPVGEDLGGGSPDFKLQEPLNQEVDEKRYPEPWYAYLTRRPRLGGGLKPPQGGVPPPNVFGVWSVAVREGVWENKALRFEFSGRRSYGFCSRLCPRQVLGISALSSAGSWTFLTKLAEDLSKKNENPVKKACPK